MSGKNTVLKTSVLIAAITIAVGMTSLVVRADEPQERYVSESVTYDASGDTGYYDDTEYNEDTEYYDDTEYSGYLPSYEPAYAQEDELTTVTMTGSFDTVSKQTILNRLNEIRKEACDERIAYATNTSGNPVFLSPEDYSPLQWSSELEEVTMLRAVEASVRIAHERPNGRSCFTAYPDTVQAKAYYYGENLAWNYSGIMEGIEQFYEEKKTLT